MTYEVRNTPSTGTTYTTGNVKKTASPQEGSTSSTTKIATSTNYASPNLSELNTTSQPSTESWKLELENELKYKDKLQENLNESPHDSGAQNSDVPKPSVNVLPEEWKRFLGF
ncbi:MAG: hypothetical protein NTW61_09895 [Candidatus Melainabacteria bacterium]|nr:hypothetical protein [Candidatus Melainabacteria bacterium]